MVLCKTRDFDRMICQMRTDLGLGLNVEPRKAGNGGDDDMLKFDTCFVPISAIKVAEM